MEIYEYSDQRADVLRKLIFPQTEASACIKLLWVDSTVPNRIDNAILMGQHTHQFYEIHFVLGGNLIYSCGEDTVCVENKILILSPETKHRLLSHSESFLKITFAVSPDGEAVKELFPWDKKYCVLDCSPEITENLNHIFNQCDRENRFTSLLIYNRVFEIIYLMCKSAGYEISENTEKSDRRVLVAKRFIIKNRHRPISCSDVAKECWLSTKQLNRIFKKHTGKTVNQYIISDKAEYSAGLLLQSERPVKEIGYMVGFENECSFSLFFKRCFGVSPTVYKAQNKSKQILHNKFLEVSKC